MILVYLKKLSLQILKIDIGIQKTDGSSLATLEMIITRFKISDKLRRAYFFQETLLLVNTNINIILKMPFLTFNNTNVVFAN